MMSANVMWMRACMRTRAHATKKESLKADLFKTPKRKLITESKRSWAHSSQGAVGSQRPGSATSRPHSAKTSWAPWAEARPKAQSHAGLGTDPRGAEVSGTPDK